MTQQLSISEVLEQHAEAIHPGTAVPGFLRRHFEAMEVVEEELEAAGLAKARAGDVSLFYACRLTTPLMHCRNADLLRIHVRELIDRHRKGEPLEPATCLEMLCVVMRASWLAPLNNTALAALERLARGTPFEEHVDPTWRTRERYEGQVEEVIDHLRTKVGCPDRAKPFSEAA